MVKLICRTCGESKNDSDFIKNITVRGFLLDCKPCYNKKKQDKYSTNLGSLKPIEGEIWKDIPGYEGLYKISQYGRVYSCPRKFARGGIFSGFIDRGYVFMNLTNGKNKKKAPLHQIVADCFLKKPDFYECINHIDGNKSNNHFSNLEYTTIKGNAQHAWDTGLCDGLREICRKKMTGKKWKDHSRSIPVLMLNKVTKEIMAEYESAVHAYAMTGINSAKISSCCTGKRQSTGGYSWKHKP
jgi:hypothetical protein